MWLTTKKILHFERYWKNTFSELVVLPVDVSNYSAQYSNVRQRWLWQEHFSLQTFLLKLFRKTHSTWCCPRRIHELEGNACLFSCRRRFRIPRTWEKVWKVQVALFNHTSTEKKYCSVGLKNKRWIAWACADEAAAKMAYQSSFQVSGVYWHWKWTGHPRSSSGVFRGNLSSFRHGMAFHLSFGKRTQLERVHFPLVQNAALG